MPDISVLIPTANRLHFLANALASVSRQTAVRRIAEVVVMENGGNRASEEVCKKFPNLPIRYIFREPRVPLPDILSSWLKEARYPVVTMLHDDDWWADSHLERGVANLEQNPDASAVYSSCFWVCNETSWTLSLFGGFIAWFANDTAPAGGLRKLSFEQVLLASLLATGFHLSSMVTKKSVIATSLAVLTDGNEFDVDRSLAVELSRHGKLLFNDTPSVFVRIHSGQGSAEAVVSNVERIWFPRNTRRLLKLASDHSINVHARLTERFSRLGLGFYDIARHCTDPSLDTLYEEGLLPPAMTGDYRQRKRNQKIRNLIRRLLHPGRFFKS